MPWDEISTHIHGIFESNQRETDVSRQSSVAKGTIYTTVILSLLLLIFRYRVVRHRVGGKQRSRKQEEEKRRKASDEWRVTTSIVTTDNREEKGRRGEPGTRGAGALGGSAGEVPRTKNQELRTQKAGIQNKEYRIQKTRT